MGFWMCKVCGNGNNKKPMLGRPKEGCSECGAAYGAVSKPLELAPPPLPPQVEGGVPEQPGTVLLEDVIMAIYHDVRFIRESIKMPDEEEEAVELEPEPVPPSQEELMALWRLHQSAKQAVDSMKPAKIQARPAKKPGPKPKTAKAGSTVS
jgi:hypothetical protein